MYDSREKAIRDYEWKLEASRLEGEAEGIAKGKLEGEIKGQIKGEIKLIRMLESILGIVPRSDSELAQLSLDELSAITLDLQSRIRNRTDA